MAKNEKKSTNLTRAPFLTELNDAYNLRRKNLLFLTGDVHGLFASPAADDFVSLEEVLCAELAEKFNIVRMDIASGVTFYDDATEKEVIRICESKDGIEVPAARRQLMESMIGRSRHSPLQALVLMRSMTEATARVRGLGETVQPMCFIVQYSGALFPSGDFGRLAEIDRQRLVYFLYWATSPAFAREPDLLLLVHPVKSEINDKVTSLPVASHLEIALPELAERRSFVDWYRKKLDGLRFAGGWEKFCHDAAGLTLGGIRDLLTMVHRRGGQVEKADVVAEVNRVLEAELGEIIRIKDPQHGPEDIVGYKHTGEIFQAIFERCEDPETAVSAILVSGPNGGGKTFQLEAFASASGRIVIELAGIRGSFFGETDRFFELLRWHIRTFGKILILVDEAHTAFGSIHSGDTHKTEKRLSGNIIKMMGDPSFLGKVLWGLMTSRPDELDPDVKSRSPIQVPIFDLEDEERGEFVTEMFRRKKIDVSGDELESVLEQTGYYSARDYRNLVAEVLARRRKAPDTELAEVLETWQASRAIEQQRELQTLIAAQHCSYQNLLPQRLRDLKETEIQERIELLKRLLHH